MQPASMFCWWAAEMFQNRSYEHVRPCWRTVCIRVCGLARRLIAHTMFYSSSLWWHLQSALLWLSWLSLFLLPQLLLPPPLLLLQIPTLLLCLALQLWLLQPTPATAISSSTSAATSAAVAATTTPTTASHLAAHHVPLKLQVGGQEPRHNRVVVDRASFTQKNIANTSTISIFKYFNCILALSRSLWLLLSLCFFLRIASLLVFLLVLSLWAGASMQWAINAWEARMVLRNVRRSQGHWNHKADFPCTKCRSCYFGDGVLANL